MRNTDRSFSDCLDRLRHSHDGLTFVDCGQGMRLRAERLKRSNHYWEGDFVRQQIDNVPPKAREGKPLEVSEDPIGHRAAFVYSEDLNILAIQSGRPGVSTGAVNKFLRANENDHRGFMMAPCLSNDALDRVRRGTPKKLSYRLLSRCASLL